MMRYLSICSGIEAATVAWHPLGWTPAAFAEIEPFPSAVLAQRWPDVPNLGDFTTIKADDVGPVDLLVGGTPCQSFSIAGLRGGMADDRGNLALEFLRLAQRTRPQWLVWENVPGVLSSVSHAAPDPCPPPPPVDLECTKATVETEDEYDSEELHDFYSFLAGLSEIGYGFAYGVLDAQYFNLAQRRERVFVVGYLGDWRPAAAVLFERESLSWNPAPSREKRKSVAGTLSSRSSAGGGLGTDFEIDGGLVAGTLGQRTCDHPCGIKSESDFLVPLAFGGNNTAGALEVATARSAMGVEGRCDFESETFIAHALRAEGFDASEDGTGRGTPLVPVAFDTTQITSKANRNQPKAGAPCHPLAAGAHPPAIAFSCKDHGADASNDLAPTLHAMNFRESHANAGGQVAVAFRTTGNDGCYETGDKIGCLNTATDPNAQIVVESVSLRGRDGGATAELGGDVMPSLRTGGGGGDKPHALTGAAVRRLTPRECERLQGFPDGYTLIPTPRRSKAEDDFIAYIAAQFRETQGRDLTPQEAARLAADGPRYRALGNSMTGTAMRWIGERITEVEAIVRANYAAEEHRPVADTFELFGEVA